MSVAAGGAAPGAAEETRRGGVSGVAPNLRSPVAVVVSRFPRLTETFILREIDELERRGQPVRLVPLLRESPPVVHPEARPWVRRALYTPFLSRAILGSNLRALARRPGTYMALLARLVRSTAPRPGVLWRTLVLWPKAVHLGERLEAEGVRHLHAHFATYPATVAWVASRLFDLTFSFTAHAHDLFVHRVLLETKVREARFVRTISRFNREFLERLYPAARSPDKVTVIPMGIDPARYGGSPEGDPTPRGPARLLCVAALKPYKGLPVLLAACEALAEEGRDFVCEVVGEGPDRRALEREIRRRSLGGVGTSERVRLLGARPQTEVARMLARADVFVLPSVVAPDGQMEGLPVVLMEALASRRPTVATRLSGIPELVEDGVTGLLVEPGDPEALAAAVARLLDEGETARRCAEAGRRRVEDEYDLRHTAVALAGRLDDVATGESGRLPAEVSALAAALLSAGGGGEGASAAGPVGLRRLHESPDARVAELLLPAGDGKGAERGPREVVVKQARDRPGQSRPPRERARWEHEVLTRLHGAGVAVPRPLGLFESWAALAMEAVEGEPLEDLLRRRRGSRPSRFLELERAFQAAGTWLRKLQVVTRGPRGVGRHGDFWPGNVRVRDGEVTVLDLEGFEEGAEPTDDVAHFLVTSGLYLVAPHLGGRRRRLERAFRLGWSPTLDEEETRRLERAMAREARRLLDRGAAAGGGLRGIWRRRWLGRLADGPADGQAANGRAP